MEAKNFAFSDYWSSTELKDWAWAQFFKDGSLKYDDKKIKYYVRAVRAF